MDPISTGSLTVQVYLGSQLALEGAAIGKLKVTMFLTQTFWLNSKWAWTDPTVLGQTSCSQTGIRHLHISIKLFTCFKIGCFAKHGTLLCELARKPHLAMPLFAVFSPCAGSVLTAGSCLQDAACSWSMAAHPCLDIWHWSCSWSGFEHLLLKLEAGWELLNSRSFAGFPLNNIAIF